MLAPSASSIAPPHPRKRPKKTGVYVTPRLTLKRQVPTRDKTLGRCVAPSLPGRGRWPFSRPTSGSSITGQWQEYQLADSTPTPSLSLKMFCSVPLQGVGWGRSMGSRGTARKFRDAARSSGTLAASPRGFVAATLTCSMPWEREPPPRHPEWRVEGQTRAEGCKGAWGSAGSRGRPRPLTCAAGGSCRQRRRGR